MACFTRLEPAMYLSYCEWCMAPRNDISGVRIARVILSVLTYKSMQYMKTEM